MDKKLRPTDQEPQAIDGELRNAALDRIRHHDGSARHHWARAKEARRHRQEEDFELHRKIARKHELQAKAIREVFQFAQIRYGLRHSPEIFTDEGA